MTASTESKKADRTPLNQRALWDLTDLTAAGVGSRTTVWRLSKSDKTFPRPVVVRGLRRWIPEEIQLWVRTRPRAAA